MQASWAEGAAAPATSIADRTSETAAEKSMSSRYSNRRASGFGGSATPAPPLVHEVVHHLAQLADGAALAHDVAGGRVERHHAVADTPAPLALGVQPDDALHPLADLPERPRLGVVVVVARVAQQQDGRLLVERLQLSGGEAVERVAEVGAAMIVHWRSLERPLDGPLDRVGPEGLADLGDFRHEHVGAHAAEALLQAPHELQHEAGGVAHRVGHVADGDELGL